ncbi:CLIP-associating protein 1-B-like [Eucyclogobius newberryi]|uniref:CLIP-associating protein 1-B-like n=1 Tax=Eucyclogobius newberryi TaxID=166745 RepID=UPI003B5A118E
MEPEEKLEASVERLLDLVMQKDVGIRTQTGLEIVDRVLDPEKSPGLEQDQSTMDRIVDTVVCSWVNSSNFKIVLLGMDILSALVTRLQESFRTQVATVLPSLMDRLGDTKDQVRDQDQALLLKIMDQAANPQFVWERMMGGFKHKNSRTREGLCLCLIATLNVFGSQSLTLSKIVPHICNLLGDPTSPVREVALNSLVEIYRHVGEKVRIDLGKKGLPQSRLNVIFSRFDEVQRSGNMVLSPLSDKTFEDEDSSSSRGPSLGKKSLSMGSFKRSTKTVRDGSAAGAVDEEDFIQAFEDVPTAQIYSNREMEEAMAKIRDVLSDDKRDWELRVAALKKVRSMLLAGAADFDSFPAQLKLLEAPFKQSVKDLRSQVVREACITLGHLSSLLRLRFDHAAESVLPSLLNLVPNCAKVMATSGVAAIRLILRHTHFPRLIPIITSSCVAKSVAVRRRSFEFLELQLELWQTLALERHGTVLSETIKKGIHDADSEARSVARKCYWAFHSHFSREAELLFHSLELSYQKALQAHRRCNDSVTSLPPSDRSSSSSQESLSRPFSVKSLARQSRSKPARSSALSPVALNRSRSNVDVNAAASANRKKMTAVPTTLQGFSTASALPPGSYASLDTSWALNSEGRVRTLRTSSGNGLTESSQGKPNSQSQPGSRSGSPGRLLGSTYVRVQRSTFSPSTTHHSNGKPLTRGHRSQGCSRETSPSRNGGVRSRIPRPSVSQGCSRENSRDSSRDTSPTTGLSPNTSRRVSRSTSALTSTDGYSERFSQQARISASVNAMRILNTGTEVEAAVADALLLGDSRTKTRPVRHRFESPGLHSDDEGNSDASSACSERSYSSRNGSHHFLHQGDDFLRQTEDVADILNRCASANWTERKEGLLGLQQLLQHNRTLSRVELKRLCEIFTRMFADPHSKVFSMFLETLVDFVALHRDDLHDWLFVLLTQLLKKMGADLLGSVQAKVQRALDVTRESFPCEQQFNILMRFIVDQTQTPNLKVKVAILKYIQGLAALMDPSDFSNSSETRLAVSRIITWTTEPKSADVRKFYNTWSGEEHRASAVSSLPGESHLEERCKQAAQVVLIGLFELNTPEFSMLLGALPKTFQDGTTKLLHHHLRSATAGITPMSTSDRPPLQRPGSRGSPLMSPTSYSHNAVFETDPETSDEVYGSKSPDEENRHEPSKDTQFSLGGSWDSSGLGDASEVCRLALDNKTSLLNTLPHRALIGSRFKDYNPQNYSDSSSADKADEGEEDGHKEDGGENRIQSPKGFPVSPSEQVELVGTLLKTLSQAEAGDRGLEQRKCSLLELLKMSRVESAAVWDEHFKTTLLLLLETLNDSEHSIRALSLRLMKEILKNQPLRFKNYAELTIMKTLEAHKDSHKEVVRAAEDAACTLALSLLPEQCLKVLCPIVQTADFPVNMAAIKMQTRAVDRISREPLLLLLPDLIPGLLQGYDNAESSVRKASVFCLVSIYAVIGEDLKPFLSQLTGSKMKLLNLYIKRAQTTTSNSSSSSDISSY